jgi:hypothetical protein
MSRIGGILTVIKRPQRNLHCLCWVCVIFFAQLDLVFATLRWTHKGV